MSWCSGQRLGFVTGSTNVWFTTVREAKGSYAIKIHYTRKISEPCLWFLVSSKASMLSTIGEQGSGKPSHTSPVP